MKSVRARLSLKIKRENKCLFELPLGVGANIALIGSVIIELFPLPRTKGGGKQGKASHTFISQLFAAQMTEQ